MVNFIKTDTSFANGEVSPIFFANSGIHGLARMENFDVVPGGGLTRRPGLKKIAKLSSSARLVSFSVSEDKHYVLAIMNGLIRVFIGDEFVQDVIAPWNASDIGMLQYAQRFGTMIFVHPNYIPKILYVDNGIFKIKDFSFSWNSAGDNLNIPFMRFEDSERITISLTNTGDGIKFTTNYDFWTQDNVNGYLSLLGKTWIVTSYIDAKNIIATCNGAYTSPDSPVSDWTESVFGPRRGWPSAITFHQDRLVFGGAKSWPGGVWMSHVGDHRNFNVGTGLDDEAIYFTLVSDRRQHICTLVSSDNLQILTSEGEWAVSSKPLTPESIDIKMHTSVGSPTDTYLPPQQMEDKTVFVSNNKHDIRELVLDNMSENYTAENISELSSHLIDNPVDMAYNKASKKLFVVMSSGNMAVLNYNKPMDICAWGRYTTNGKFYSVVACNNDTFVVTKRGDDFQLEYFSDSEMTDSDTNPYTISAVGVPLMSNGHNVHHARIKKITVRLYNSKTLFINNVRANLPNEIYSDNAPGFSGDISVNILGTGTEMTDAPWEISTTDSLPITILSVTIYGRYQI
ncbi:MAG: hypothetical protein J6T57_04290 [Alphaproteobacteria bacterium]|nr:hypothetical protein [Alphaproteobacteria bacterium]